MLGKLLIFNLISYNTVCNTNTTTNANEIKALTRIESEKQKMTKNHTRPGERLSNRESQDNAAQRVSLKLATRQNTEDRAHKGSASVLCKM